MNKGITGLAWGLSLLCTTASAADNINTPAVDGGYADARFTRNVGKGDFSGDFFQGICRYE